MHGVNLTRCLVVDAVAETPADLSRGRVERGEEDRDRGTLDLLQRGNRVAVVDLHLPLKQREGTPKRRKKRERVLKEVHFVQGPWQN